MNRLLTVLALMWVTSSMAQDTLTVLAGSDGYLLEHPDFGFKDEHAGFTGFQYLDFPNATATAKVPLTSLKEGKYHVIVRGACGTAATCGTPERALTVSFNGAVLNTQNLLTSDWADWTEFTFTSDSLELGPNDTLVLSSDNGPNLDYVRLVGNAYPDTTPEDTIPEDTTGNGGGGDSTVNVHSTLHSLGTVSFNQITKSLSIPFSQSYTLELVDAQGAVLRSVSSHTPKDLTLGSLPTGVYWVRGWVSGQAYQKSFFIQ